MIIVVFLQIDVPQSLASCTYTCTLGYLNALLSALGEHWLSASLGPVITAKIYLLDRIHLTAHIKLYPFVQTHKRITYPQNIFTGPSLSISKHCNVTAFVLFKVSLEIGAGSEGYRVGGMV